MRTVPELVFLNCCHLAARDAKSVLAPYDRAAVRRDHRRGADRDRRALRHRRRLGGRGQAGRDLRDHVLRRAARRRPLHRRRRRRAQRRLALGRRRQHLVGVPVLRRPGLDLAARRRRRAARRRRPERRVRRRVVAAGADARARDDLDPPALRRRRPEAQEERRAGAARQDPLPRGEVRAAVGQDGRGRRSVRPRLGRRARPRQGDRVVPGRRPGRGWQRFVQGRRGARQPAGAPRRGARRPGGGPARCRGSDRAPGQARRDPDDGRARGACSARRTSGS